MDDLIGIKEASKILNLSEANTRLFVRRYLEENRTFKIIQYSYVISKKELLLHKHKVKK